LYGITVDQPAARPREAACPVDHSGLAGIPPLEDTRETA
jgi:hypothetical protein